MRRWVAGPLAWVCLVWGTDLLAAKEPTATPPELLKTLKGFRVELLYSVPREQQGSWVNLCVDPQGRLIVSDQHGGLYRVTVPRIAAAGVQGATVNPAAARVEPIPLAIGEAQGLVWAFDSLYVVVNSGGKYASGVYRCRDTNGDDQLDSVETLRLFTGRKGGEHGPHAILPTPDGKGLFVVVGNQMDLAPHEVTRVPPRWGEDHLLPRMPDGRGFMKDVLGPGGAIYRIDPAGQHWEVFSVGFRNQFDAAVNRDGELFTYDADMEWDFNTPWYRPTRVCHVVSGSEFGWRNGAGKWPPYYPDSTPAAVNIGPGSPTGVTFGYGAKFPAKYQEALFINDWSYGKLYAVHLTPQGSTYTGTFEEFVTGSPLPLTDTVVHPDGALYFLIGGRKTTSGLYRVVYAGDEPTAPVKPPADPVAAQYRAIRRQLEGYHGRADAHGVTIAWPYLSHGDRFIRSAARTALEFQPVDTWRDRALAETDPRAAIQALLALVRCSARCPFHRQPSDPPVPPELLGQVLTALGRIAWSDLTRSDQLDLLRVYAVAFNRLGAPDPAARAHVTARLDAVYPAASKELNAELSNLLVYLQAPTAAAKTVALLQQAPTQEEQIEYARALRMLTAGWTLDLRRTYFEWFLKAAGYRGGASFANFVQNIKRDAVATLTPAEAVALQPILEARPPEALTPAAAPPRPFVKDWKLDELVEQAQTGLKGRSFERGKAMFAAGNCFACHRYDNQGGAFGPDLTNVAGRFSARDLLESIVDPSKVISDQYAAVTVVTSDGKSVTGRIVNLNGDTLKLNTNMLNPDEQVTIDRRQIEELLPSKVSMMPAGLLNTLHADEILDLLAYLLSRGDAGHPVFRQE